MSDNTDTRSKKAVKRPPGNNKVMFFGGHINFLAKSLKDSKPTGVLDLEVWKRVVHTIAHDIHQNNKLFEPARFYESCGMRKDEGV